MRKFFLIIFLTGSFINQSLAQEDSTQWELPAGRRQSKVSLIKDQILGTNYWEEKFRGNWSGIFLGINGLAQTDYSGYPEDARDFLDPELLRSYVFNINPLQFSIGLQRLRNTIGLVTGLGFEVQSWHLDNDHRTITKGPYRVEPVELTYDNPRKSKLISTYLTVPLLAEFQIPLKQYGNRIYFSAGVIAGARLSTHTRIKYTDNEKDYKVKSSDDYYLRDFRYSATFKVGYRWINLFATYDLRPVFKEDKGPEVYPWSVGIALISF